MVRVKTFTSQLKILATMKELNDLDEQVNQFIEEQKIQEVVSVSDTCTSDETGATMGIIRVLAYRQP
jgi:hypothetical protein